MKVIATTLLAAAASLPLATHAVISHARTSTPFLSQKSKQARGTTFLNVPRGGDLGPIKGSALAKTFGVLAIGDGLAGTLAPVEVWDKFGIKIERGSKGEHYLGHGLASSATSLAVTSLLALTGKTSAEAAIGYGFLARCAYMTDSLLTGTYKELGVPTVPHVVIYLILLGTAFGLISGNANYVDLAKVVSLLLAGHGGLLLVNPRTDDEDETKKMAKVDGGYLFASSLYAALLAFGTDPVTAMGYAAIACLPVFLGVVDLASIDKLCGLDKGGWTFVFLVFFAASAYGMLS